MPKLTIHDLYQAKKQGRPLLQVNTVIAKEAAACVEAGVDIIAVMKHSLKALRAVAPQTFLVSADDLHDPRVASPDQCVAAGFELLQMGADAVYTGMSLKCVEAMAREKIPTMGHVGFVPYRSTWYGGTRAIGKSAAEALEVYRQAKRYQDAGAIAVEIEIVPARVCAEIARRLDIILISMGSGTGGNIQYLFACDVLGTNTGHVPRHSKVYANLAAEEARLQRLRVEAFGALRQDVYTKAYPGPEHQINIDDQQFEEFVHAIEQPS